MGAMHRDGWCPSATDAIARHANHASMAMGTQMTTPTGRVSAASRPRMAAHSQWIGAHGQHRADREQQEQGLGVPRAEIQGHREGEQVPGTPAGVVRFQVQAHECDEHHRGEHHADVGHDDRRQEEARSVGPALELRDGPYQRREEREERGSGGVAPG